MLIISISLPLYVFHKDNVLFDFNLSIFLTSLAPKLFNCLLLLEFNFFSNFLYCWALSISSTLVASQGSTSPWVSHYPLSPTYLPQPISLSLSHGLNGRSILKPFYFLIYDLEAKSNFLSFL